MLERRPALFTSFLFFSMAATSAVWISTNAIVQITTTDRGCDHRVLDTAHHGTTRAPSKATVVGRSQPGRPDKRDIRPARSKPKAETSKALPEAGKSKALRPMVTDNALHPQATSTIEFKACILIPELEEPQL